MSANQGTRTYVLFITRNGPSQFPSPLPLPPVPVIMRVPKSQLNIPLHHVVLGLMSFTASTAVAPIERVHLLIQNQHEMIKSGCLPTPYKGIKDCFLRTLKQDGFFCLWRGNCVNLCKAITSQALAFAICKNSWHNLGDNWNDKLGYLKFEAAVCAATLFHYPLDYARTRLATDVEVTKRLYQFSLDTARKNLYKEIRTWEFSGMFDVFRETLLRNGIAGLYRGYFLSLFGILAWDFTKKKIEAQHMTQEKKGMLARNIPVITVYSLPAVLYPLTRVSRRMMMNSGKATTKYENTVVHNVGEMVKQEGLGSLYKGVTSGITHWVARIGAYIAVAPLAPALVHKFNLE